MQRSHLFEPKACSLCKIMISFQRHKESLHDNLRCNCDKCRFTLTKPSYMKAHKTRTMILLTSHVINATLMGLKLTVQECIYWKYTIKLDMLAKFVNFNPIDQVLKNISFFAMKRRHIIVCNVRRCSEGIMLLYSITLKHMEIN